MRTKLIVGLLVLFCAVAISAVAAYFSVVGLAALFAAAFLPVAIMGVILEGSKLVAAGWLHSNWRNTNVGKAHKGYLVAAILTLMAITSMGIYGYLARAHLEQTAPTAAVQIDIDQKQAQIDQLTAQRDQLLTQQKALNETVSGYLGNGAPAGASQFLRQQRSQQENLQRQVADVNQRITEANVSLAPLKKQVAGAEAELGPLKYIAKALGMKDPEAAVNLVILMLMFAFDPLAVVMMISGTITIGEWQRARREAEMEAQDDFSEVFKASKGSAPADIELGYPDVDFQVHNHGALGEFEEYVFDPAANAGRSTKVTELPDGDELGEIADLAYFKEKAWSQGNKVLDNLTPEPLVDLPEPVIHPPKPTPLGTIDHPLWPPQQLPFFDGYSALSPEDKQLHDNLAASPEFNVSPAGHILPVQPEPEPEPKIEPDAKAQLVQILESRPELLEELVQAVEETRRSREEASPPPEEPPPQDNAVGGIPWLDPK